jgi:3-deoxy-D-arabino-heptulosonate 7-phosphate (DAHP) synthase
MLKKLYEEPIEHRYNAEEDHSEDLHKTSFEQLNEEPLEHLTTIDNNNEQKEEDHGESGRTGTGQLEENEQLQEVAPPGKEKQVKALKKEFPKGSASPFKIAWSQYNKSKK